MIYDKELQLYRIAERQGGYFSLSQAKGLELQRGQIYRGLKRKRFEKVAWGVYRFVQFPAARFEEVHIAVLSAGEQAIVGFQTALYIYELSDIIPDEIHLILPPTSSRRRPGVRVHTVKVKPSDITMWEDFKITTVARTIVDVARTHFDEAQIELAVYQALVRGLVTKEELVAQAMRSSRKVEYLINAMVDEVKL